jgi:hypothetical protein
LAAGLGLALAGGPLAPAPAAEAAAESCLKVGDDGKPVLDSKGEPVNRPGCFRLGSYNIAVAAYRGGAFGKKGRALDKACKKANQNNGKLMPKRPSGKPFTVAECKKFAAWGYRAAGVAKTMNLAIHDVYAAQEVAATHPVWVKRGGDGNVQRWEPGNLKPARAYYDESFQAMMKANGFTSVKAPEGFFSEVDDKVYKRAQAIRLYYRKDKFDLVDSGAYSEYQLTSSYHETVRDKNTLEDQGLGGSNKSYRWAELRVKGFKKSRAKDAIVVASAHFQCETCFLPANVTVKKATRTVAKDTDAAAKRKLKTRNEYRAKVAGELAKRLGKQAGFGGAKATLKSAKVTIVIMGDFNTNYLAPSSSLARLRSLGFTDARKCARPKDSKAKRCPDPAAKTKTTRANVIDHIFVKIPAKLDTIGSLKLRAVRGTDWWSDHKRVSLTLKLKDKT